MLVSRSFIFAFVLNPKVILNVALKSDLLIISKSGIMFNNLLDENDSPYVFSVKMNKTG